MYAFSIFRLRIDTLNYLKVHVGTNFLNTNGNLYDVAGIKNHEHYDIALIYLKTSITYDISVQPISLMTSDKNLEGNPCMLPGWGSSMVIYVKLMTSKSNSIF